MSRSNKVNPDHYKIAGRLSADDLARERVKQAEIHQTGPRRRRETAQPPWMAHEQSAASRDTDRAWARDAQRSTKASGASDTPSTAKAPRARKSAERGASPERAGSPGAHATASRGRQKRTAPKGKRRTIKSVKKR